MGSNKKDPADSRKVEAGKARAHAALTHLQEARRQLNSACADLCSIVGANDFWRTLSRLSNHVGDEIRHLDQAIHDEANPLWLDREPTELDFLAPHRAGCGGVHPRAQSGARLTLDASKPQAIRLTADAEVDAAELEQFLNAGGALVPGGYKLLVTTPNPEPKS